MLLYCLGEETEDVLVSTGISDAGRKKNTDVFGKFNEFSKVRKNVILNMHNSTRDCGAEMSRQSMQYITCLYNLADDCQFRDMKDARCFETAW